MSEQATGLLVLFVLSLVCAVVAHWLTRRYWLASASAAIVVAILFEAFARARWNELFLWAWAKGLAAGFPMALAVGLFFRRYCRRAPATRPLFCRPGPIGPFTGSPPPSA